jgi:hypothetical protein
MKIKCLRFNPRYKHSNKQNKEMLLLGYDENSVYF